MKKWNYISTYSDLGTKIDVVCLKHQLLYSRESNPVTNSVEGLVSPRSSLGILENRKIHSMSSSGIAPQVLGCPACAILASYYNKSIYHNLILHCYQTMPWLWQSVAGFLL
jgi:hypothetical protein